MTEMVPTRINDRWTLNLPRHRAERPGWSQWERDNLAALWCLIRPGDVVWDIGAEEGDQSALMASWGAQMCLVESSARSWPWIKATFEANGLQKHAARCAVCLVGDLKSSGDLQATEYWPSDADGPFVPEAGFVHLNEAGDTPIRTLDSLWEDCYWPTPNVVVMDIEGAELRALNGGLALLASQGTTFVISVHPEFMRDRFRDTPDDLIVLMEKAGYQHHYLGFTHEYHHIWRPGVR